MTTAVAPLRVAAQITMYAVKVVALEELQSRRQQWEELARSAVTPNPFYEPWLLLPAVRYLADRSALRFVCVFGRSQADTEDGRLLGLFPLELRDRCLNLPIRNIALWQHRYCFLTMPLIDQTHVWPVLDAFWRWLEGNACRCNIFDTNHLLAEGEFQEVWADFALGRYSLVLAEYPRAVLKPETSAEDYIASTMSKKHRDEYRRQERRLHTMDRCEYHQATSMAEAARWVEEFVKLESKGWKGGPAGGAFAARPNDAEYLRAITLEGITKHRAVLLSLRLGGKPIAMKYNLLSAPGSFAFKITFDEDYAKYSPGVHLEFENIRRAHSEAEIHWMDSCATPRHAMVNRLWKGRRMIRRTLFSVGSRSGDLTVSALPLLRWAHHQLRPQSTEKYFQVSTQRPRSGE